ncbi:hypothetical protein [Sandaracinus amylolyticus]|uniref:Uncharacterized protein n=1 Tax=Sandaracinus amylolyticus TaxID=927083 RepID=A0A0F6W8T0_9BACT|nr:hypothetical protein [Sandaracinus amylolyticus]AKF10387.1 hypothetical protein DB32_007536 [Sandaracinus amylolyticus]
MASEERAHGPATKVAIRNLSALKPEHQQLLRTLLADAGMATATLETLVEHLLEEEDTRLQTALSRVKAGHSTVEAASAASARRGATVGSLRTERGSAPGGARGTVGSLRK